MSPDARFEELRMKAIRKKEFEALQNSKQSDISKEQIGKIIDHLETIYGHLTYNIDYMGANEGAQAASAL